MTVSFRPGGKKEESKRPVGRSGVLYGPPFSGKTSTLQYDKSIRVLLIDFDKNSAVLESEENVDILGVSDFEEYLTVKEGVRAGTIQLGDVKIPANYDLYVVDSFTSFEEKIKDWVVSVYAPKRAREIEGKFGARTDWQDLQDREIRETRDWQEMTRRVDKPINVLWIGHDMESTDSDDFKKKMQLRLQGKYAAPGISSAVDAVFYMYKHVDLKEPMKQAFGIYTIDSLQGQNVILQASARLPVAERQKMPQVIWWPKWGEVYKQLGATNLK